VEPKSEAALDPESDIDLAATRRGSGCGFSVLRGKQRANRGIFADRRGIVTGLLRPRTCPTPKAREFRPFLCVFFGYFRYGKRAA
jgi:hypothetical protein